MPTHSVLYDMKDIADFNLESFDCVAQRRLEYEREKDGLDLGGIQKDMPNVRKSL